jgi:hypothetical protein
MPVKTITDCLRKLLLKYELIFTPMKRQPESISPVKW